VLANSQKIVDLEISLKEKEREMELLQSKYKEVKTQKNILKKEVIKLMNEIKEQEQKIANS